MTLIRFALPRAISMRWTEQIAGSVFSERCGIWHDRKRWCQNGCKRGKERCFNALGSYRAGIIQRENTSLVTSASWGAAHNDPKEIGNYKSPPGIMGAFLLGAGSCDVIDSSALRYRHHACRHCCAIQETLYLFFQADNRHMCQKMHARLHGPSERHYRRPHQSSLRSGVPLH